MIADDVAYFDEPFFQDGPVAVAVNKVTAAGAAYFSAAGNNNLIDGGHEHRLLGSAELPRFRRLPAASASPEAGGGHCMDFNPGAGTDNTFGITVATAPR